MTTSIGTSKGRVWQFGPYHFSEVSYRLSTGGHSLDVERKPLEVLLRLLERPNQVSSKDYLLDAVWPDVKTTEESLTVAISKLRKIFGGPRNSIILNAAKEGYRMAVPVTCSFQEEAIASLELQPGDPMPRRPNLRAVKKLSSNDLSPVWLARNPKTGEERVYKFALDGVRLRALQREVAVFRLLTKALGEEASFLVPLIEWSFEDAPFFLESRYCGENLLEWSKTAAFQQTTEEERIAIIAEIATDMASSHRFAVLHNDLKPSNLLVPVIPFARRDVRTYAKQPMVHIADFGVASLQNPEALRKMDISDTGSFVGSEKTPTTMPLGTEMYRAPECRAGDAPTVLNDIYAVGVLLYQLTSGNFHEPPLPGWDQKIADPQLRQDIADAANVNPAQRLQTMAVLADRLNNFKARRKEKECKDEATQMALHLQESLARTRMRRPWVILAMVSLGFGLIAMTWTAYRVVRERNEVQRSNASLEAMYRFLAIDVLGQSNPYLRVVGSGDASKQTLLDAMAAAVPQIDSRFAQQPRIAGRLHETIADSYKDRTRFSEADREYTAAAMRYRQAEGELSQAAIIAELKREFADITSMVPGTIKAMTGAFARQEALTAQIKDPSAELQAWFALVKTTLIGMGAHPEQAIPLIRDAVNRAEGTPGFDPMLLVRLRKQFCGTYVRLGDGANLERVSRESIAGLTRQYGADSPLLLPYEMYLEEAFYLQGRYPETVAQADKNFAQFNSVLSGTNQLTMATLAPRAAAEGQMERYKDAIRDDLALNAAARLSGDKRLEVGSSNDAAAYQCRMGNYAQGMARAREVIRQSAPGPLAQPMFFNGSMFTLAECLVGLEEDTTGRKNPQHLQEAKALLEKVNVSTMAETSTSSFEGHRDVALARLSLLQGSPQTAKQYVALAEPFFTDSTADPYERRSLDKVKSVLAKQRQ